MTARNTAYTVIVAGLTLLALAFVATFCWLAISVGGGLLVPLVLLVTAWVARDIWVDVLGGTAHTTHER
ncbi:hypothetical protein [Corynebacterium liangguodongii]|uniref:Uncharacterized protein n=1 Tax=Corynebacterium liangguodongii TaxID=2079535 RepID=A0A2S0WGL0_9CORY|nr:hypothetical protein [Corynebacterium liangguodongii]AWB84812.1 hypothetical protein C3E79_10270 [Corynebacterium liangguodongii]PWB99169.1 hypothetical protein DF219_07885 [Corynebacterium liangguodongii]